MSGKPKGPRTPEQEREELRQLTRELHEAAQDARDAARELRAERKIIYDTAATLIREQVTVLVEDAVAQLNQGFTEMKEATDKRVDFYMDHVEKTAVMCIERLKETAMGTEARLTGYDNPDQVADKMMEDINQILHQLSRNPEFIADVAARISGSVGRYLGDHGGSIMVGTREQVDRYVAAGGDPGIVLDAR